MILPATYDIVVYRNGVYRDDITVSLNGVAQDITGWHARLQVRTAPGAPDPALIDIKDTAPTSNGGIITFTDAPNGKMQFYMANADLAGIPVATQPAQDVGVTYDLVLTEPGGDFFVFVNGSFTIKEGVTR